MQRKLPSPRGVGAYPALNLGGESAKLSWLSPVFEAAVNLVKIAVFFVLVVFAKRLWRRYLALRAMENAVAKKAKGDEPDTFEAQFHRR